MPRYYQDRQYERRSPIGYAPQVGGIGYISHRDPNMVDRMANVLGQRQERYDTYNHTLSEALAEYGSIPAPMSDQDDVMHYVEHLGEDIQRTVDEDFGGDYGLAGKDIVQRLARARGKLSRVGRDAQEEQRYRQLHDQLRVQGKLAQQHAGYDEDGNPILEDVDPFSQKQYTFEDGQLTATGERDYTSIRERSDYFDWGQRNLAQKLNQDVRSELFKRLNERTAGEYNVDPRLYFIDERYQGYAREELQNMIDEGDLLNDQTLDRFLQDTSFGFEYGTSKQFAREYLGNMLMDQVSHGVQQSVRGDEAAMAQLKAKKEDPDSPGYQYKESVESTGLKDFGVSDAKSYHEQRRQLLADGRDAEAARLEFMKDQVSYRMMEDTPAYSETLSAQPRGLFSDILVNNGIDPELGSSLEESIMESMNTRTRDFNRMRLGRVAGRNQHALGRPALEKLLAAPDTNTRVGVLAASIVNLSNDVSEQGAEQIAKDYMEGAYRILDNITDQNPELKDMFFEQSVPYEIERPAALHSPSFLPGMRNSEERQLSTITPDRELTDLGRETLSAILEYNDYYHGEGEYEGIPSYKQYSKDLNRAMKNAEFDHTHSAYGFPMDISMHNRNEHVQKFISTFDRIFKDPDILTDHEEIDPDKFNINNIYDVFIYTGNDLEPPKLVLHSMDDDGKERQVYRGTLNFNNNFNLHNFKQLTSVFNHSEDLYNRAVAAAVPITATPRKNINIRDIVNSLSDHPRFFEEAYPEIDPEHLTWEIKNMATGPKALDTPLYQIVHKDTDQVFRYENQEVQTPLKYYAMEMLFKASGYPLGSFKSLVESSVDN